MKKTLTYLVVAVVVLSLPAVAFAAPADEEKKVFTELSARIPKDHIVSVDDLYKKWQEVQEKKSKAVILDIRFFEEFDNGHLAGSNNIDSGVPYLVHRHYQKKKAAAPVADADFQLRELFGLGHKKPQPEHKKDLARELSGQLDLLRKIYVFNAGKDPETNLDFISARVRDLSDSSAHQFGMKKIFSTQEFLDRFQSRLQ